VPTTNWHFILGIRPDVIRAALILDRLRSYDDVETVFIGRGNTTPIT